MNRSLVYYQSNRTKRKIKILYYIVLLMVLKYSNLLIFNTYQIVIIIIISDIFCCKYKSNPFFEKSILRKNEIESNAARRKAFTKRLRLLYYKISKY